MKVLGAGASTTQQIPSATTTCSTISQTALSNYNVPMTTPTHNGMYFIAYNIKIGWLVILIWMSRVLSGKVFDN